MAQDPLQIDAIKIEPSLTGTRLIDSNATGDLRFSDLANVTGITLSELAGLQTITSIYTVGLGGPGAQYNSIQDALDAVPATSDALNPSLILVGPGRYTENITIEKDGVWVVGLGATVIDAATADATITLQASVTTAPKWCRLQNLRILNANIGEECIVANGLAGSEIGQEEFAIINCELVASGAGTYTVYLDTVNNVRIQGGSFEGSSGTSISHIENCYKILIADVAEISNCTFSFDTTASTPSLGVGGNYQIRNTHALGNMQANMQGGGVVSLYSLVADNLTMIGDQFCYAKSCQFDNVVVDSGSTISLSTCTRNSISGSGSLEEELSLGVVTFTGTTSENVVFLVPHPDIDYIVYTETEVLAPIGVSAKATTGFTLSFSGTQTTSVFYSVIRSIGTP